MMYCTNLSSATDTSQVGGKAANLGKALSLGMRVPSGFVLTRAALALFLEEAGMAARVRELLKGYSLHDSACRKRQYEALCSGALAFPLPEVLKQEVAPLAERLLESVPAGLAVRSSGVCEDSDRASFAGIFKSFLCVSTIADLWEKILRCWCSAWSPHLVDYATKMGLAVEADGIAVIVQEMVQADSAGVLFTADPLTGNPWQFVLNATCGLAQRMVDGSAPVDRFVLEWDTGQVLEKYIVEKGTASIPNRLGVQEVRLPDSRKHTAAISDETARQIGQMALRLDRALDRRVDIEWAMAGQDIYLVQVRPVTALPAFFPRELSGSDVELTWTLSDPAWYTSAEEGGRIVAPLFRDRWALELWRRHLAPGDIFPRRAGLERDFNGYRYSTEWTWQAGGYDFDQTIEWLNEHESELRNTWIARKEEMLQACAEVAEAQKNARRATELVPILLAFLEREADMQATVWAAPQWMIFTCEYLLEEFLKGIAPEFDVGELVQGLPCYSYERTKAAQDLGRSIQEGSVKSAFAQRALDEVIPYLSVHHPECQFLNDYERFCWQFGMCPPTWPKQWARWSQDTAQILFVIKSSALGQGQDVEMVLDKCARNRKASEEQIRLRVSQHAPALLGRFERLLAWAQFWVPALDDRKWHCAATTRLADLLRQTGTMLVEEGLIDAPADVLLFTVEDLERMANDEWRMANDVRAYRELYLVRKREYERNRRLVPPEYLGVPPVFAQGQVVLQQEPEVSDGSELAHGCVFKGQGLVPGHVTGVSRKVVHLNDLTFLDSLTGEHILVCAGAQTWWTDWLSLFTVVKGLVTVQGAQLHHAVQIARECGVVYINLPDDDLASIPDGAKISLNGGMGTVTVSGDQSRKSS